MKYGRAEDEELTPIVLEDGQVTGWGWTYLRANEARFGLGGAAPPTPGAG